MKTLYTDGSCINNPGPGGWAWACEETKQTLSRPVPRTTTNNEMELFAILEALAACDDGDNVVLYSDSKLALDLLSGRSKTDKKHLKDLVIGIRTIKDAKRLKVELILIRGHKGNFWNEKVDKLANAAARQARSAMGGEMDVLMSEDFNVQTELTLTLQGADRAHIHSILRALNQWGILAGGTAAVNRQGQVTTYEIKDNMIA